VRGGSGGSELGATSLDESTLEGRRHDGVDEWVDGTVDR